MERGREAVAGVEELSADAAKALDAIVGTTGEAGRHARAIAATAAEQLRRGRRAHRADPAGRRRLGPHAERDRGAGAARGRGRRRAGRPRARHPRAGRRGRRPPAHRPALRGGDLTMRRRAPSARTWRSAATWATAPATCAAARDALARLPGTDARRRVGHRGDRAARRHAAAALPQPDGAARDAAHARGELLEACQAIERARGPRPRPSAGAPGPSIWTSCATGSGA